MPTPFRLAEPSAPPEAGSLQSLASVMAYGLLAKLVGTGVVQGLEPGDPRIIGPYRLLGQLGSGGMGRVFLGLSAGGRRVAVKVIRDELAADPEFRVRFRREVAAARTVSGVFTAAVVDADVEAQAPWLATAYVPGPSLAQAVRDHGPLPAGSVLALAAGLAESLAAIHAAGVVHRDLKPSNVLLAQDGPRVIDFGISRAAETTSLTGTGLLVGSPGFMSPEQAAGGAVGPASDMFSLGAVLAFAATGKAPFGSGSMPALVYRVVHDAPDLDQVPGQVRPLIGRCLAKDPGDRPGAASFLAEIGSVQPVTGWLPEAFIGADPQAPAPAAGSVSDSPAAALVKDGQTAVRTVTAGRFSPSPPPAGLPTQPGPPPWFGGNRSRRPMVLGWVCGVVAASVLAVVILNVVTGSKPPHQGSASTSRHAATPVLSYRFGVTGATQYSCSSYGSVRSASSTSKVMFTFINNSSTEVSIIWLNFSGNTKLYDTLPPGYEDNQPTYIGHYWLIASSAGGCLGIFGINGSGQIVTTAA
jgi:hypothetical protein